ncbi:hypothetical protein DMC25_21860 [Caulobacter sp. D4A]|uniref:polymorphic toxin-type HINT domain-containing protein n=1 Tax=unclassified Caulobacter TaxID=2648921 RepID=UPI000D73109B|nr:MULTISPECIES: polymorphic toxin-type HINT domain-containing protein [unclassified Caulobacter]PXA79209.1 hypothetical protein DMC25_21860 [Caulobacter sp. D4A]PXA88059.1 hypothetical protein DMC18_19840 [Caulobacter sp. D5]
MGDFVLRSCVNLTARLRAFVAVVVAFGSIAIASPVMAQAAAGVPPSHTTVDENSIDLLSGRLNAVEKFASIGDENGLYAQRVMLNATTRYNLSGTIHLDASDARYVVSVGIMGERFYGVSATGPFYSTENRGSTLTADSTTFTYTMRDGTVAVFEKALANTYPDLANQARLTKVTKPDGEVVTYIHFSMVTCIPMGSGCQQGMRDVQPYAWSTLGWWAATSSQAFLYNMAVDACGLSTGCTTANSKVSPRTDLPSYVWSTPTSGTADGTMVATLPTGETKSYTFTSAGVVKSVVTPAGTWTYNFVGNNTGDPATSTNTMTVTDPLGHVRTVVSTQGALIKTDTDALGKTTSFVYDDYRRLKRVTRPEGDYTEYTYDLRGNVTESRQVSKTPGTPADIVARASFPTTCSDPGVNQKTCNKPIWTQDALGLQTDYTYHLDSGAVATVTSPAGANGVRPQVRYAYGQFYAWYKDANGVLVRAPTPVWRMTERSTCATGVAPACLNTADEQKTVLSYGVDGTPNNVQLTAQTEKAGSGGLVATTAYTHDAFGNVRTVDGPLSGAGDTTWMRYDSARRVTGVIEPAFVNDQGQVRYRAVRTTYDASGRPSLVESGVTAAQSDAELDAMAALEQNVTLYDSLGRVRLVAIGAGGTAHSVTQVSYDAGGRLSCSVQRMNIAALGAWPNFPSAPASACAFTSEGAAGPDRITSYLYDNAGRVTKVTEGYGTAYATDIESRTYTDNGLIASQSDGRGGTTTYERDGQGRLIKTVYPGGSFDQHEYDASSRVTRERRRDGQWVDYGYDGAGRITSRSAPASTYAYDNLGRQLTASAGGQTVTSAYDVFGNLKTETTALGEVSYTYDEANRRTAMTQPGGFTLSYAYDAADNLLSISQGGARLAGFDYDNYGRRTKLRRGAGDLWRTEYAYANGDLISQSHILPAAPGQAFTRSFSYNAAGQLIDTVTTGDSWQRSTGAISGKTYTYDAGNKLTAIGADPVGVDGRGNLASVQGVAYGYDIDNRLTGVSGSAPAASLTYDPLARLASVAGAATTRFLYDGSDIIAEYDAGGALLRRYVHGPGEDEPLVWFEGASTGDRRWFAADERGSVIGVVSDAGVLSNANAYDEYGLPAAGNIGRFQYTGQAWIPELGLYHYKARAYSPALGRFLQPDPAGYIDGLNLYAYVGGDPLNVTDPSGMNGERGTQELYCYGGGSAGSAVCPITVVAGPSCNPSQGCYKPEEIWRICGFSCTQEQARFRVEERRIYEQNQWMWIPVLAPVATVAALEAAASPVVQSMAGRAATLLKRGCGKCFAAGTLVATANGLRPIEEIGVGDLVLSRNEETGEVAQKRVVGLRPALEREIWEVALGGGERVPTVIRVTDDHPFHAATGWVVTSELRVGQRLDAMRGDVTVVRIINTGKIERIYNFEVADFHTYFVGDQQVWVHNVECVLSPQRLDHVFTAKHKLGGLVAKFGSREAAANAIHAATASAVKAAGTTGVFEMSVKVAGATVTVTGNVVNGALKFGNAWIP